MKSQNINALPSAKVRFVEPMYARLVNELSEGKDWLYEVKLDGYRCLAGKGETSSNALVTSGKSIH